MRSFTTYRPTGRGYILKIRACFAKSSILIFTKSLGCDFSIRSQYAQVNSMQRSIKPPSEAKCLPRSLESQCYWKATEWRVFLLLYSVVILKGVFCLNVTITTGLFHLCSCTLSTCQTAISSLAVGHIRSFCL